MWMAFANDRMEYEAYTYTRELALQRGYTYYLPWLDQEIKYYNSLIR
jgi:hypothetical protein